MSTSLMYHGYVISGCKYVSTEYTEGAIIFSIRQERNTLRCSECNSRDVICKGRRSSIYWMVSIGYKKVCI